MKKWTRKEKDAQITRPVQGNKNRTLKVQRHKTTDEVALLEPHEIAYEVILPNMVKFSFICKAEKFRDNRLLNPT